MGEIRSSPLTNEKEESRPKCIMRTLLINTTQIKPIDTKNITPLLKTYRTHNSKLQNYIYLI